MKLSVQRFQCIEAADLELGPHLNVLYGPNDLGKSSLAWAIRAVLLLQHGSAHAERFTSWYDGGEPRVALTFAADDGRYWRVTKTFGGSAGRSTLESSKDGRSFIAEANGRQVDERLRELLSWGVAPAGARGRAPFPESFLTQVLLADQAQDSVRKVLFESKLDADPDESGRKRLISALGALAQDPLFKDILDKTTDFVGRAFTPTGRPKRGAGSPWLEVADRIKSLRAEQEQLQARVKDTEAVEQAIRQLHDERDRLHTAVAELADVVAEGRRQLARKEEVDAVAAELEARTRALREVEALSKQIAVAEAYVTQVEREAAQAQRAAERAGEDCAREEASLTASRTQLDAATLDDSATAAALVVHQRRLVEAEADVRMTSTAVADAAAALRAATRAAAQVAETTADEARRRQAAEVAETAAHQAQGALDRAEQALADAQQRLRDAQRSDGAQARELRRQELENRRLSLEGRRTALEATLQTAQRAGQRLSEVADAERAALTAERNITTALAAVSDEERRVAELDSARQALVLVEAYGRFRELRERVQVAARAGEDARREETRAADLRTRADELRSDLRTGLPGDARLVALRSLREELRVAEAALGGGMSVAVRPKRAVRIAAVRDGVAESAASGDAPLMFAAQRTIALAVDDLVEIEITAGEDAARARAAELRARWLREGEATLVEHHASTLEALETACARARATERELAECEREAALAAQRAQATGGDLAELRGQLAAAEAALGDADREDLMARLARLGESWQAGLRRRQTELDADLERRRVQLDVRRTAVIRAEATRDAQHAELQRLRAEAAALAGELSVPWAVAVAASKADLATLVEELADVARQVAALSAGASDAQAAAAAAVEQAQASVEAAAARLAQARKDATDRRMAHVKAVTQRDGAVTTARQLDRAGVWAALLDAGEPSLPLGEWEQAHRQASEVAVAADRAQRAATEALREARAARDAAVQDLRRQVQEADARLREAKRRAVAAELAHKSLVTKHQETRVQVANLRVEAASTNVAETQRAIDELRAKVAALGPVAPGLDAAALAQLEANLARQKGRLVDLTEELAKKQGALEQVGGAIVRERLAEIAQALQRATEREREVQIEYEGWRLLQEALRASETSEAAHLGRALAGPVSAQFRQLTGGRYGELELGAHLEAGGIQVAGDVRELGALSAGTQDQLATLLRVCIAQQLHSAIVLDDHLSQSDAGRIAWFNDMLRGAAATVQIVFITCRPGELLAEAERAGGGGLDAPVRAVDLAKVIRRYATTTRVVERGDGTPRTRTDG
ncbi:MAG: AAA family ATPase [Myxococcales bacterium]|nr:AAA family ATPase [Myxococcales bacterium]